MDQEKSIFGERPTDRDDGHVTNKSFLLFQIDNIRVVIIRYNLKEKKALLDCLNHQFSTTTKKSTLADRKKSQSQRRMSFAPQGLHIASSRISKDPQDYCVGLVGTRFVWLDV